MKNLKRKSIVAAIIIVSVLGLSSCGDKFQEPFKDSPRSGNDNTSAADVIEMPDGFSNAATKCDHGNRIYVAYHGDKAYASLFVVPNAEGC